MKKIASTADPLWYKDAIIYELHVRAFADSNNDGIGEQTGCNDLQRDAACSRFLWRRLLRLRLLRFGLAWPPWRALRSEPKLHNCALSFQPSGLRAETGVLSAFIGVNRRPISFFPNDRTGNRRALIWCNVLQRDAPNSLAPGQTLLNATQCNATAKQRNHSIGRRGRQG